MMRRHDAAPTMLRHERATRIAHGASALGTVVLVVSGLGMAEDLPGPIVSMLGGHVWLGSLHRRLGLAAGVLVVGLLLFGPAAGRRLVRDVCRFNRGERIWFNSFARYLLAPRRFRPPFHDGRFDPGQRLVFAVMFGSFMAATGSAAVLYLAPHRSTRLLAWTLQVHIVASVALTAALALHIAVGAGILRSHRNIGRTMFGDGRVQQDIARTLWPKWAASPDRSWFGGVIGV